jgi:uncharacterized membrane protein
LGLLIAILSPAWTGYDEFTHFARVVDMAHGNLEPESTPEGIGSVIPMAHREATTQIILDHQDGRPPWTTTSIRGLLDHRPDGRMAFIDTRPTSASTPVAYLPAATGSLLPVALGAPGVLVLWAGRVASLLAYLALGWWAVRSASAFRWSLTAAALLPLNLALAASVSPDGFTVAAVLVAVSLWTRVEADETISVPAMVLPMVLLALAKPPYFLVLGLFPLSAALDWSRNRSRLRLRAALIAGGALGIGLATTLARSSENYQAATTTMIRQIEYQPSVQRDRLLGDLPGFVWATVDTWISEYRFYVQGWFRQLGFWEADLPGVVPWLLVGILLLAVLALDGDDLRSLRGARRGLMGGGVGLLLVAIYGASYVYFTDLSDYGNIGLQMARYSAPLAILAFVAWTPRMLSPVAESVMGRMGRRSTVAAVGGVPVVAVGASVVTWLWTGANTPLG